MNYLKCGTVHQPVAVPINGGFTTEFCSRCFTNLNSPKQMNPPIPPLKPQHSLKAGTGRLFLFHRRELCDRVSPRINPQRTIFHALKEYHPSGKVVQLYPVPPERA